MLARVKRQIKRRIKKSIRWLNAHRSQYHSKGIFIAFLITLFLFLGIIISPFLIPAGTLGDGGSLGDDGKVGLRDFYDEFEEIDNPLAKIYYTPGDLNCHQHDSRSYFLNENQLPLCARDTAIFFGLAIGVLITFLYIFELNIKWLVLAFVPIGLDGGLQLMTSYEASNISRLITGTIAGIATGVMLGIIIRESANLIRWRKRAKKEEPK